MRVRACSGKIAQIRIAPLTTTAWSLALCNIQVHTRVARARVRTQAYEPSVPPRMWVEMLQAGKGRDAQRAFKAQRARWPTGQKTRAGHEHEPKWQREGDDDDDDDY